MIIPLSYPYQLKKMRVISLSVPVNTLFEPVRVKIYPTGKIQIAISIPAPTKLRKLATRTSMPKKAKPVQPIVRPENQEPSRRD